MGLKETGAHTGQGGRARRQGGYARKHILPEEERLVESLRAAWPLALLALAVGMGLGW